MSAGLDLIFLRVAPTDIALIKFLFESYEGVAVVRTMDRRAAIIVAIVSHDFVDVARGMLDATRDSLSFEEIPPPADAGEDWLLRLVWQDEVSQ